MASDPRRRPAPVARTATPPVAALLAPEATSASPETQPDPVAQSLNDIQAQNKVSNMHTNGDNTSEGFKLKFCTVCASNNNR